MSILGPEFKRSNQSHVQLGLLIKRSPDVLGWDFCELLRFSTAKEFLILCRVEPALPGPLPNLKHRKRGFRAHVRHDATIDGLGIGGAYWRISAAFHFWPKRVSLLISVNPLTSGF